MFTDNLPNVDRAPRYAPAETICKGFRVPVARCVAHPVGQHPAGCPLVQDCVALELVTEKGSRWLGFEKAWINSELRMVVQGFDARDEVLSKWERASEGIA